ncbi:unnamed protein product [Ectocarpus sp. CCAP 1310/34]|nr:unnamed protein product [Ectocarpus sp. CCAP 1310/34]
MTILKLANSVSKSKAIGVSFVAATATTTVLFSVLQSKELYMRVHPHARRGEKNLPVTASTTGQSLL